MPEIRGNEPVQIRLLFHQFLLRVVDLEALSSKADVVRLMGQFATILLMFSLIQALVGLLFGSAPLSAEARVAASWTMEYHLLSMTLLVVGLFSLLSWDAMLPDRRDVFVLGPLPVRSRALFLAKVAACGTAVGLSALTLNAASGLTWPLAFAQGGVLSIVRCYVAYWIALIAASVFLFSSILLIQSASALLLPRKLFLQISTILQVSAFVLLLGIYFLQPKQVTPAHLLAISSERHASWFPPYCFVSLFYQMRGSLPSGLAPLAWHAWVLIAGAGAGAAVISFLSYGRILRNITAAPDIVPSTQRWLRVPNFGRPLQNAIVPFIWRSLLRSRQHRLIVAFYLGVGFSIVIATVDIAVAKVGSASALIPLVNLRFLISTTVLMSFAVVGVRVGFSFPISRQANWTFRVNQMQGALAYTVATRRALLLIAVTPVCLGSAIYAALFEPRLPSATHLALLALYGVVVMELSLFEFRKIPYTCSYLPGKGSLPFAFWAFLILFIPLTEACARLEQRSLRNPVTVFAAFAVLTAVALALGWNNRRKGASADLLFDDTPDDDIVGLQLTRD